MLLVGGGVICYLVCLCALMLITNNLQIADCFILQVSQEEEEEEEERRRRINKLHTYTCPDYYQLQDSSLSLSFALLCCYHHSHGLPPGAIDGASTAVAGPHPSQSDGTKHLHPSRKV